MQGNTSAVLPKASDHTQQRPRHAAVPIHELALELTIVVPAYNEADNIADTIRSLLAQTVPAREIIVVDDGSSDATGDIARSFGVTVLRPAANTGSKGRALNLALEKVRTELTMTIDADTVLAPNAVEKVLQAFDDPIVGAACGFVIPRYVNTLWERGRYIEYLLTLTFHKAVQDYYGKILVASGCFAVYRTGMLREVGGWSARTVAEDMDLTWCFELAGYQVRFVQDAFCYPIEPHNFTFLRRQLTRWTHGFVQNLKVHRGNVFAIPHLRSVVTMALWEVAIAPVFFFFMLPFLIFMTHNPYFLIGYVLDAPAIIVPVAYKAIVRREVGKALVSMPAYFVMRAVNAYFFYEALWSELVMKKELAVFEKGH